MQAFSEGRLRAFIVDDHELLRMGVAKLLVEAGVCEICGEAGDSESARSLILKLCPDVAIIDLRLNGGDGLELVKTLHAADPAVKILVFSALDEDLYAERSLRAGALGYISKLADGPQLLEAIRAIANGKTYLSPRMVERIVARTVSSASPLEKSALEMLSDREMEVFEALGRGQSAKEIAHVLNLSPKTVEYHRQHIKEKLKVSNSAAVVRLATAHALGLATEPACS